MLKLQDRSNYRFGHLCNCRPQEHDPDWSFEFDSTLGYPGEGPWFFALSWPCITIGLLTFLFLAIPSWIFLTVPSPYLPSRRGSSSGCWGGKCLLWLLLAVVALGRTEAMPIGAMTASELRKAAERRSRAPLELGRPVTEVTSKLRTRYWDIFKQWTQGQGVDLDEMLDNHQSCIDELNLLVVRFGRLLYNSGKTYTQYAETINALSAKRPALRRMLQQCWDLGYSWMRSEPPSHHVAMPVTLILSMVTLALMWGWTSVAGCLVLGYSGLLRPGEILGAFRKDLLLPRDIAFSADFALLSIREPKSRFTYARHQAAKIDSPDFLQLIETLPLGCRRTLKDYGRILHKPYVLDSNPC